ncbi:hypothetical protein [Humisphaera borealis]|uniref:Uncharacterized protein n=1 Tax=Humisphaera borealis TaxID=2807512 RepID=A0A7M2WR50_9BACT|nr:hypothetical protein [Humisphaera borealis]QOV87714.1 hypothetical protein IPV69_15630 [Humisphaera borealis]
MSRIPHEPEYSPADLEFERALGALRPGPAALDPRSAMFEAGRSVGEAAGRHAVLTSARGAMSRWRATAAVLAIATGVSVTANVRMMSGERPIAVAPPPVAVVPSVATGGDTVAAPVDGWRVVPGRADLLAQRTLVLADGIDALPAQRFGSVGTPLRVGDMGR